MQRTLKEYEEICNCLKHLHQAEKLVTQRKHRKVCYALSRSVLQATRTVVWKEAKCTTSSYEKIVKVAKNHLQDPLPERALKERKKDFKTRPEELERRLEPAREFLRTIIKNYVQETCGS